MTQRTQNWYSMTIWGAGVGGEVGEDFRREGPHVFLWLIHVDIWQRPSQYCKVMILQLK